MYLLLCLFALDLIGLAVFSYWTIRTVQVNGPLYHNIVTAKDLVADVLPPPKYLVESYLVVLLMMDARGPENLTAYIDKSRGLREEYTTRQEFWLKELPQGQLKRLLCETSHRPAMEFFEIRDNQFIPALRAGRLEQARTLAQGPLRNKYEEHRVQIDRVVELATAAGSAEESRAAAIMRRRDGGRSAADLDRVGRGNGKAHRPRVAPHDANRRSAERRRCARGRTCIANGSGRSGSGGAVEALLYRARNWKAYGA